MRGGWRRTVLGVLLGLAVPALAGCTYGSLSDAFVATGCDVATARAVTPEQWQDAAVVVVRVRQDEFTPMLAEFERGRPYILQLINGDERDHVFRSKAFFANVSIAGLSRGADELQQLCRSSMLIPAGKTAEIRFVPIRDGHYDFYDGSLPMVFPGESSGIIVIR